MLNRADLWSLEQYSEERPAFREKVLLHKKDRQVLLGDHLQLVFEDQMTIQYQIQEMLRIERIFEGAGIQDELDAYNPLIPDGNNWKATLLIQYQEVEERKIRLAELVGIEEKIWVQIGDEPPVLAIADEDMERSNDNKTSAVHFLRFQLPEKAIAAAKSRNSIRFGVDHPQYESTPCLLSEAQTNSLVHDLK